MSESFSYDSKHVLESYKLWRKNVPYNYDLLLSHSLTWPSLTVQFFPTVTKTATGTIQNLLLSTHTSSADTEYLTIASVSLPDVITDTALEKFNHSDVYGDSKVKVTQQIALIDEVNKARYCPFATNVIATRSDKPDLHVFDTTKHRSLDKEGSPDVILKGHENGGYGLCWSSLNNGYLLSAGDDGLVCLYDINSDIGSKILKPINQHRSHTIANDCFFSFFNPCFATVGDDRRINIYDIREMKPMIKEHAHNGDILCVSYSPIEENYFATGSKDGLLKIWDERKMEEALFVLETGSENDVLNTSWSPHIGSMIVCGGTNRRACVYDISRVGMEQTEEEKQDGPPELMFIHGGHTDTVCDLAWNPMEPYEIASVAEDNILQIWQMTNSEIAYENEEE